MKENSYILHCYDNLVAMTTSNNCIFSLAAYSSLSPCIMCVQYCGVLSNVGVISTVGDIMCTMGDILSTLGVFSTVGDILSTMGCSVPWGYHEYHGGVQYSGGYHDACGGIS